MTNQSSINQEPKTKNKFKIIWIVIGVIILLGIVLILLRGNEDSWIKDKNGNYVKHGNLQSEAPDSSNNKLNDKFGFLGGGSDDTGEGTIATGAGWVRPHPGGFVWDSMQAGENEEFNFKTTDEEVNNMQKNNLNILATIWGFANWDQKNLANAKDCKVSPNDEFLLKNDKKGRGHYLPEYRCNPNDWESHNKWVQAIVERYDGDGISDMAGLTKPIKYWEVMNEPDLNYGDNLPKGMSDRLNFYKQGPNEYAELLIETNSAIKKADANAQVLIAGAAGSDERMLDFYENVLAVSGAKDAFDIGNVHCISNDQLTHDFNVTAYKNMLETAGIEKLIWVTEAEAMYGKTAPENFTSTQISTKGAISAGAQKIFYTRYDFDDFRTDMSQKTKAGDYPSQEKYQEIFNNYK